MKQFLLFFSDQILSQLKAKIKGFVIQNNSKKVFSKLQITGKIIITIQYNFGFKPKVLLKRELL